MWWHGEDTVEDPVRWKRWEAYLVEHFVWEVEVQIWDGLTSRKPMYKYDPAGDWSEGGFGIDPTIRNNFGFEQGLVSVVRWMVARGRWPDRRVGKMQRDGAPRSYFGHCEPGLPGEWCTFRFHDFSLLFAECQSPDECYMPGGPLPAKDREVPGTCRPGEVQEDKDDEEFRPKSRRRPREKKKRYGKEWSFFTVLALAIVLCCAVLIYSIQNAGGGRTAPRRARGRGRASARGASERLGAGGGNRESEVELGGIHGGTETAK